MMLTVAHCGCLVLVLAATPPSTRPADAAAESRGLFLQASDLVCEKLVDPEAKPETKEFAVKVLRFAITGSQKNYEAVAATIDRLCKEAMDSGQPKLSFAVRNSYKERAQRYYYTYSQASDLNEAREALDSIIKAVFYNANEWVYWACASAAFLDRAEQEAVYDPSKAELYAKFAMAMNPRDPYPYARLVAAYFALGQFEESDRIATRALEVGRFERPHFSSYQGDDGRAYFNDYKGRCCLRTGDVTRARDYLLTAFTLGRSAEVVQPYLCEALVALAKDLKPLKIGESKGLGFDLGIMDNQYVILRLAENSVARSAGLQVGDHVVHVDGVPSITRQNYSRVTQAIGALLSGQREQVLLEVRRDDQVMLFLVTK